MRFLLLCKRHYTNKDLIADRYGRLFHLPVELGKLGHDGLVIAADYRSGSSDEIAEEGVRFHSEPLSGHRLVYFARRVWLEAKRWSPDVILASGDTHLGAFGGWLAKHLGTPFVFDVYDDYRVFASARFPGMRSLFRRTLERADLVVCAGKPLERMVQPHNASTVIIENGVDTSLFRPMARSEARAGLNIGSGAVVVGFLGSIEANRGVDVLVDAVHQLRSSGQHVLLLLAGVNHAGIDVSAPWVNYRGVVPQGQVPALINACDVVVIPYLRDPQVDVSSASKIPEYLACGVPIVTTRVSNYGEVLGSAPHAICEPGDVAGLASAILAQVETPMVVAWDESLSWSELGRRLQNAISAVDPLGESA